MIFPLQLLKHEDQINHCVYSPLANYHTDSCHCRPPKMEAILLSSVTKQAHCITKLVNKILQGFPRKIFLSLWGISQEMARAVSS